MKLTRRRREVGNTIVVTLITLAIVAVFVDLSLQYTNSVARNVRRSILLHQATNIADSSTEMAFSAWRNLCQAQQTKTLPGSSFSALPTPSPGNFPGVSSYYLTNFAVDPLNSTWAVLTANSATPAPIAGPSSGDMSYYYLATADVIIPTVDSKTAGNLKAAAALTDPGNIIARVRRVFDKETISLWRYAVFFNDDLEMHPGANMTVNGDVHTNGSLYTAYADLTLNGKTTYVDNWSIGFMAGDGAHNGITPQSPTWAAGLPPASAPAQQPYGVSLSDYHQLIEYTSGNTPLDPYTFQDQAGYVITIDANNSIQIYNASGTNITNKNGNSNDAKAARALAGAITPNQTLTDNREGATTGNASIRVATLDVSQIEAAMDSSVNNTTFTISKKVGTGTAAQTVNNLIYIVDTSAGSDGTTNKRGIRLLNGGTLPNGGLTIVSGNPVYVQGDYNSGAIGTTTLPPSDGSSPDSTQPTVNGYTRQPAAIVGDAITVLSNSWKDLNSGTTPAASNTTVNAAFISGQVPTGNGYYSGGVENFPRFLENWSGNTFTYYGSMIELYKSQQAIGHWGASNVYSAPNRAWYFDTNFVSTPPPGILASFNYIRGRWYMQ